MRGSLLPKPSRPLGSLSLLQRQGSPIAPLWRELSEHKEQVSPGVSALDRVCGTKRGVGPLRGGQSRRLLGEMGWGPGKA